MNKGIMNKGIMNKGIEMISYIKYVNDPKYRIFYFAIDMIGYANQCNDCEWMIPGDELWV